MWVIGYGLATVCLLAALTVFATLSLIELKEMREDLLADKLRWESMLKHLIDRREKEGGE